MLSRKARYALHALFVLGARKSADPMMIADIAKDAKAPRKFLEQILLDLKNCGLVHSHRGKHGGYTLGRPPEKISFAEVFRTIDGPLALSPCASRTAYRKCADYDDESTCAIRKVLLDVRNATADILENRTIAQAISFEKKDNKEGAFPATGLMVAMSAATKR